MRNSPPSPPNSRALLLLLLPLLFFFPIVASGSGFSEARAGQSAYISNRTTEGVTVSIVQAGRPLLLGSIAANETRSFRLSVVGGQAAVRLSATSVRERSITVVSDPISLRGGFVTWEILQMPTPEIPGGVSAVLLR